MDLRRTDEPVPLAYQEANRNAGRYFGELRLQTEYKGRKWPVWRFLRLDPETLGFHASKAGWSCQVVMEEEAGNYLGRLARAD